LIRFWEQREKVRPEVLGWSDGHSAKASRNSRYSTLAGPSYPQEGPKNDESPTVLMGQFFANYLTLVKAIESLTEDGAIGRLSAR